MKTKMIFGMVMLMALAFNACKKPKDGKDGAQGPQGPAGNANVNVQITTVTTSDWIVSAPSYYVSIYVATITQAIVDNGAVLVYISNGAGGWEALPVTIPVSSSYSSTYNPVHYLYGVTIWKTDTDYTQATNPGTRTFKILAIASSARLSHPNLDYTNYEAVKKAFNLPN